MADVISFNLETNEITERGFTEEELAFIEANKPTKNDLINQQINQLKAFITNDIRDRAMLGDTADLKSIYDQINVLKNQLV